ncbi:MAG: HAD-IIIC family phosphatase [Polyangiales bacterium]
MSAVSQPHEAPARRSERPRLPVRVAATFTAEPLSEPLELLLELVGLPADVRFADYNQVLQTLLAPSGVLFDDDTGVNVVLVRCEDWVRFQDGHHPATEPDVPRIRQLNRELTDAVARAAARSHAPMLVAFCPSSPTFEGHDSFRAAEQDAVRAMKEATAPLRNVRVLSLADDDELARRAHDPERDALGHIPYTPDYFAVLGTILAREVHAERGSPAKVAVLDCDNTLWRGVVGEDGAANVEVSGGYLALQRFMVEQQGKGLVLALNSKNAEEDVMSVFATKPDMPLRLEHLVAWQINWERKSENLLTLARELNLGIDSFVFIDDNPIECAEVRARCPGVTTLLLPPEPEIEAFLRRVWKFDIRKVTEEDRRRTEMYRQNAARQQLEGSTGDIDDFIAGLQVEVDIGVPAPEENPRVAQLTQRTNQFNLTTIRRTEPEIAELEKDGLHVLQCRVRDRFGDYGLVGVMIYQLDEDAVVVDTLLLSCRVLGRGVEHAMVGHLGTIAEAHRKSEVLLPFVPTPRNQPARTFIESFGQALTREENATELTCRLSAETARQAEYSKAYAKTQLAVARQQQSKGKAAVGGPDPEAHERIAGRYHDPSQLVADIAARQMSDRDVTLGERVPPSTPTEWALSKLWSALLRVDGVGIQDRFEDLGGTSLVAASLFAEIERQWGTRLPLTTILDADTIATLAQRVDSARVVSHGLPDSVVTLRPGNGVGAAFLVHDGFGETLLYRNLARRLPPGIAVYGLEPKRSARAPITHTRIDEMAEYYAARILATQPDGPYVLGGMCAGGVLAHEVARQLLADGHSVAFVGIMDAAARGATPVSGRLTSERWARFASTSLGSRSVRGLLDTSATLVRKASNLARYAVGRRLRDRSNRLRIRHARRLTSQGRPVDEVLSAMTVQEVYDLAELSHEPGQLSDVPIVVFAASAGVGEDTPYCEMFEEPDLGWSKWSSTPIEVLRVPGGHSSMLQEPNVSVMANRIARVFDGSED